MTYIILQTIYCITFSVACFLILKKIYIKKLEELENKFNKLCVNQLDELRINQNKALISAKYKISKENQSYLSQMNKDISFKIKELTDTIKNKPII
jgi:biotin synthase-related radical SAM superfamily protein